ncbi:MAG: hydroxymethylbilane synthase [Chlamydiae bacterium]|nr:hydroxymethylbilane synthase [Chlamydiota bacterium]
MLWLNNLKVAARGSALSKAQVQEVLNLLQSFHPHMHFDPIWISTKGDKDLSTSLKFMEKTNFFSKEVDECLLSGECRIAIHSAKDLPRPLPEGLECVALTQGLDSSDSLVFRQDQSLESLPLFAKVGTSSIRRENNVLQLRSDLVIVDIRGTIEQRLQALDEGAIDALVIAEAALIRLGLTWRNRIEIPGDCSEFQGQLAVLARQGDKEMISLFACMDVGRLAIY